jgi:polygalacturonase
MLFVFYTLGLVAGAAFSAAQPSSSRITPADDFDFCGRPSPPFFDASSYGAVGDGRTLNTAALSRAISAAAAAATPASPQRVLITAGVYLSGQVVLLSGVTLCVSPTATLLASHNGSDYPSDSSKWAFVFADGAQRIGLGGGGVIDGDFEAYVTGFNYTNDQYNWAGWPGCAGECRPRLVAFHGASDISVVNIVFTGSPDWTFHLLNCSRVHVRDWTQHGDERWPNK